MFTESELKGKKLPELKEIGATLKVEKAKTLKKPDLIAGILKAFADELMRVSRAEDTICRYGGDEFLIILYETPFQAAYQRALEWREVVKKIKLEHSDGDLSISFSAGVAEFPLHGNTSDEVIICADKALYRAKEQGRDQVVKANYQD